MSWGSSLLICLFVLGGGLFCWLVLGFFYSSYLWALVFSPITGLFYMNLYVLNLLTQ